MMLQRKCMLQQNMIKDVQRCCLRDENLMAALMYGSFTTGEGDAFSDIEFALFFRDDVIETLDQARWLEKIAPLLLYFKDDFGHHTAVFQNLVRGEFHFEPFSRLSMIEGWYGLAAFPSYESTILVDRTGDLRRLLAPIIGDQPERNTDETIFSLAANFSNLMLFGSNLLLREEYARAWALLSDAQMYLLKMLRLSLGTTDHWLNPAKNLEKDIPESLYKKYGECIAGLEPEKLCTAYSRTWFWGNELMEKLFREKGLSFPQALQLALCRRFGEKV